jgi:hypothetical protein
MELVIKSVTNGFVLTVNELEEEPTIAVVEEDDCDSALRVYKRLLYSVLDKCGGVTSDNVEHIRIIIVDREGKEIET